MPAFMYRRILVCVAAFNHHVGFFPGPVAIKAFKKDLSRFTLGKGTIQLPYGKPVPLSLIRRIATFQAKREKNAELSPGGPISSPVTAA